MKKSCGYYCLDWLCQLNVIDSDYIKQQYKFNHLFTFMDFKKICNALQIDGDGYYALWDEVCENSIIQLRIVNLEHFVVLLRKGLFCMYLDQGKRRIIPAFILKKFYTNHAFIVRVN